MKLEQYAVLFEQTVNSNKKVSKGLQVSKERESKHDPTLWLRTIDYINSMDYHQMSVVIDGVNYSIGEYRLPSVLTWMIAPASVTLSNPTTDLDLMSKDKVEGKILNPEEFNIFTDLLLGLFKSQGETTQVSRTHSLLHDVYLTTTSNEEGGIFVAHSEDAFLPLEVPVVLTLTKDYHFNKRLDLHLADSFRTSLQKIGRRS